MVFGNNRRIFVYLTLAAALAACQPAASSAAPASGKASSEPDFLEQMVLNENDSDPGKAGKPDQADDGAPAFTMAAPDFSSLVEEVGKSVVNVSIVKKGGGGRSLAINPFDLFNFDNPFSFDFPYDDAPAEGFGSGFILSKDGYIMTNDHVVSGADEIKVSLSDRRVFAAKLVGSDKQSDVALLKIDATDLPAVKIGRSSSVKPGQWVAAIGAPFGFENSVTAGIVSATKRSLQNSQYTPFIQTDVAINPGNSGGPLFDLNGRVVGVNSQIFSKSGGFMGISFSVPIDVAMNVAEQLKSTGRVERGQIGIIIQAVDYDLARSFGMDKARGAVVSQISPAVAENVKELHVGDVILEANGQSIDSSADLPWIISGLKPGSEVSMKVWRDGREMDATVRLSKLGDDQSSPRSFADAISPFPKTERSFKADELNMTLTPLRDYKNNEPILRKLGVAGENSDLDGLVINSIDPKGRMPGLEAGSIILKVGMEPVNDEESYRKAAKKLNGRLSLYVFSQGRFMFITLSGLN